MKKVKLLKLELTNYRNIDHEVYEFGGKNSKIVGENRIGKTNTLEAIYFLMSGYLIDGSNDLTQLKPLADTKRVVSVKGWFEVWETSTPQIPPKQISLEKKYQEDWVKTRGTNDLVLKGHYTTYVFNDIVQSKGGDYFDLLDEHFGVRNDTKGKVDIIQMLTNPLYLGNLGESKDWADLRAFIVKIIGDVTDDEVFEAEPSTLLIKEDLEKALGKTEQVKKLYKTEIDDLKFKVTTNNSNIDMLEKTDKPQDDSVEIAKANIEKHTAELVKLQASLETNSAIVELEKKHIELKQKVLELNTKEYTAYQKANVKGAKDSGAIAKLNADLDNGLEKAYELKFKINKTEADKRIAESNIVRYNELRQEFVEKLVACRDEMEEVDKFIVTTCPTCHRPLEEKDIEEAKASFIESHKKLEAEIIEQGKANSKNLNEQKALAKDLENQLVALEKELKDLDENNNRIRATLSQLKEQSANDEGEVAPFTESDELKGLRAELNKVEQELATAKADESAQRGVIYEKMSAEKVAIGNCQKVLDDLKYYERQMLVLKSVREQRDEFSKKLADVEQKRECLELFSNTKLRLLDTHIARVFGNIRFQLIKENINGGFDPVCKVYIYDTEKGESTNTLWKSGSKSEKVVTGIAIAEAIKTQLGLTELPILFDEGGEISTDTFNERIKTSAQIICVKVEDNIFKPIVVNF